MKGYSRYLIILFFSILIYSCKNSNNKQFNDSNTNRLSNNITIPHNEMEFDNNTIYSKLIKTKNTFSLEFNPNQSNAEINFNNILFIDNGKIRQLGFDYFNIDHQYIYIEHAENNVVFLRLDDNYILIKPDGSMNISKLYFNTFNKTADIIHFIRKFNNSYIFYVEEVNNSGKNNGEYIVLTSYIYEGNYKLLLLINNALQNESFDSTLSFDLNSYFSTMLNKLITVKASEKYIYLIYDQLVDIYEINNDSAVFQTSGNTDSEFSYDHYESFILLNANSDVYKYEISYHGLTRIVSKNNLGKLINSTSNSIMYTDGNAVYLYSNIYDMTKIISVYNPDYKYYIYNNGYFAINDSSIQIYHDEQEVIELRPFENGNFFYIDNDYMFWGDHNNVACINLNSMNITFTVRMPPVTGNQENSLEAYCFGDDFIVWGNYIDYGK